jgi:hypothetical protein
MTTNAATLMRFRIAVLLGMVAGLLQGCGEGEKAPAGKSDCQNSRPICADWGSIKFDTRARECLYRAEGTASCPCYDGERRVCPTDDTLVRTCIVNPADSNPVPTSTVWDHPCP